MQVDKKRKEKRKYVDAVRWAYDSAPRDRDAPLILNNFSNGALVILNTSIFFSSYKEGFIYILVMSSCS